jgi:hypothetical protein
MATRCALLSGQSPSEAAVKISRCSPARWASIASGTKRERSGSIEHDRASAEWTSADRAARSAQAHPFGGPVRLEVLELAVDDVNGTIQRFVRTAGLRFRPSLSGGGSRDADVGRQIIRLRPRRGGAGSAVIRLAAPVREDQVGELVGCRWVVRPAG